MGNVAKGNFHLFLPKHEVAKFYVVFSLYSQWFPNALVAILGISTGKSQNYLAKMANKQPKISESLYSHWLKWLVSGETLIVGRA